MGLDNLCKLAETPVTHSRMYLIRSYRSATDWRGQGLRIKYSHKTNPWSNLFIRKPVRSGP